MFDNHNHQQVPARFCRGAFCKSVVLAGIIALSAVWSGASRRSTLGGYDEARSYPLQLANPRVVVLKSAGKLYLLDGDRLVRTYPIRSGLGMTEPKRRAGDRHTPEGRFRICAKKLDSPHHRFLGIDYPGPASADRGLREGLISVGEASAIHRAHDLGECPSWTTGLGGGIGLHGAAEASESTAGCIALSDQHVAELFEVLRIGDQVEILR